MNEVGYISTRGDAEKKRGAQAIIQGLASDRGLFVPDAFPRRSFELETMIGISYRAVAYRILKDFFGDFEEEELRKCVDGAYDDKFDNRHIAPLSKTKKAFFLELYHGRTAAFKDMALSILPFLLTAAMRRENEERKAVILTATSGDTGKAALEGFAGVTGTEVFVFYPKDGVSEIQKRQMTTQKGDNVHVFGIEGNFDDAQNAVKAIFNDSTWNAELEEKGFRLTSANSINIGRLVPQVAYYVYAYLKLIETSRISTGDLINVVVPTGNFGNILSAWYAKQLGLPIKKLICASNENKILTDFINTGIYDVNREFLLTSSPSMDILVSSNLERLLYHLADGATTEIAGYMKDLERSGKYEVSKAVKDRLAKDFYAGFADMEDSHAAMKGLWENEEYLIDTHTAVGYKVYLDYREQFGDDTPAVIASTASPYKFADTITKVLGFPEGKDGFEAIDTLRNRTGIPIPVGLKGLALKPAFHKECIKTDEMKQRIEEGLR